MAEHPVLVSTQESRAIRQGDLTQLTRTIRVPPAGKPLKCPWGIPGDVLWIREPFSTRQDGEQIKIRYVADPPQGQPRFVPMSDVPAKYQTARYLTRRARFMPKWASRTRLLVKELRIEPARDPSIEGMRVCRISVELILPATPATEGLTPVDSDKSGS